MLKQPAVTKLPTFLQYLKQFDMKETDFSAPIEKIFWSDDWNSITFQTSEFRYSIKFNNGTEYDNACREILDIFQPNAPMRAFVIYDSNTGEVDIDWVRVEPESDVEQVQFKQWDWGLTSEPYTFKPKKPASKKKPSSKMTPDPEPQDIPF